MDGRLRREYRSRQLLRRRRIEAHEGIAPSSRIRGIAVVITAILAALHPGAAHGATGSDSATADTEGSTISVSVSVTYDSSSGGAVTTAASSTSATAHVAPICKYIPLATGKGFAEPETRRWWGMYDGDPTYGSMSDIIKDAIAQDWQSHADDEQGMWYIISCSPAAAGSPEALEEAQASFYGANPTVLWVDGGSPPPARFYISPEQLARSAWDAVTIPDPSISHNPSLGTSGATLVGYETWVWAEGTPISITAVATAGETTATHGRRDDGDGDGHLLRLDAQRTSRPGLLHRLRGPLDGGRPGHRLLDRLHPVLSASWRHDSLDRVCDLCGLLGLQYWRKRKPGPHHHLLDNADPGRRGPDPQREWGSLIAQGQGFQAGHPQGHRRVALGLLAGMRVVGARSWAGLPGGGRGACWIMGAAVGRLRDGNGTVTRVGGLTMGSARNRAAGGVLAALLALAAVGACSSGEQQASDPTTLAQYTPQTTEQASATPPSASSEAEVSATATSSSTSITTEELSRPDINYTITALPSDLTPEQIAVARDFAYYDQVTCHGDELEYLDHHRGALPTRHQLHHHRPPIRSDPRADRRRPRLRLLRPGHMGNSPHHERNG